MPDDLDAAGDLDAAVRELEGKRDALLALLAAARDPALGAADEAEQDVVERLGAPQDVAGFARSIGFALVPEDGWGYRTDMRSGSLLLLVALRLGFDWDRPRQLPVSLWLEREGVGDAEQVKIANGECDQYYPQPGPLYQWAREVAALLTDGRV